MRIHRNHLMTGQGVGEQLQGQLHAVAHRLDCRVLITRQLETALQTVHHRQQIVGKTLQCELVRLGHLLLGPPTGILRISYRTQRLILGGSKLLLEVGNAGYQILLGRHDTLLRPIKLLALRLLSLFVDHVSSCMEIGWCGHPAGLMGSIWGWLDDVQGG